MSPLKRGEKPYAVALRKNMGEKCPSAILRNSSSALTLESAYGVIGRRGASSSRRSSALLAPYILQEEEYKNRVTPASRASLANRTVAWRFISYVSSGSRAPRGSLESADRWITASKFFKSCKPISLISFFIS